jgi:CAAX amino terminal protease family.
MRPPKSIIVKLFLGFSIVAFAILATLMVSEAIFPNSEASIRELLKQGGVVTPHTEHILLSLKLSQGIQTIGIFLIPAIAMLGVLYRRKGITLMITSKVYWRDLFDATFLILFSTTIMVLASRYSQLLPWPQKYIDANVQSEKITNLLLSGKSYLDLSLNLLIVCVIPAFCEEFFFRGFLQRIFMKWIRDPHFCIFLAAVIFSAFHFDPVMFFPRFLLGAMLGYLFYWTGTIWVSAFAHFVNNAQYVVTAFILNRMGKFPSAADSGNFEISNFNVILSIVLVALLLFTIYIRHMNVKMLPRMNQ